MKYETFRESFLIQLNLYSRTLLHFLQRPIAIDHEEVASDRRSFVAVVCRTIPGRASYGSVLAQGQAVHAGRCLRGKGLCRSCVPGEI